MATRIHPTAIVDDNAELGENVDVGPYCIVEAQVRIGDGTRLASHVVIRGRTTIGRNNEFFSFSSIGEIPQDLKYQGEDTELQIGDENRIREFVTMNLGTAGGGNLTRLGNRNLIMAYAHIAHDCLIGNGNILANGTTLAGHVIIEDSVVIGGLSAIHQFVTLGTGSMLGGGSMVTQDILPYCIAQGDRAQVVSINAVGMERQGHSKQEIRAAKEAFRTIFRRQLQRDEAIARIEADELSAHTPVQHMCEFYRNSERGLARCRRQQSE